MSDATEADRYDREQAWENFCHVTSGILESNSEEDKAAFFAELDAAALAVREECLSFLRQEAESHDRCSYETAIDGQIDLSKRFGLRRDAVSAVARKLADILAAAPPRPAGSPPASP